MKPVYTSLAYKTGARSPGIYKVQFAPREWLLTDPVIDFQSGAVKTPVQLVPGRAILFLEFTPESHDLDIKPKASKGGQYDEVSFSGLLNNYNATSLQVLETLRYHECVLITTDRSKQLRIIGNATNAMTMQPGHKVTNLPNGGENVPVSFYMEGENIAPFYQP